MKNSCIWNFCECGSYPEKSNFPLRKASTKPVVFPALSAPVLELQGGRPPMGNWIKHQMSFVSADSVITVPGSSPHSGSIKASASSLAEV